jgi:hypothetical protein
MIPQLEQLLNFEDLKNIVDAPKITSSGTYACRVGLLTKQKQSKV